MLGVGQSLPPFNLPAVSNADTAMGFQHISNHSFPGQWKVLFFWPMDFTFVCPTEIVGFGDLHEAFLDANAQVLGASIDSEYVHLAWRHHNLALTDSPFPWLSDKQRELSGALGILHPVEGVALRATYIIDPHNTIRYVTVHDLKVGRNPHEVLRTLHALQEGGLCGCNWEKGQNTL